jgi:hypothetical protein
MLRYTLRLGKYILKFLADLSGECYFFFFLVSRCGVRLSPFGNAIPVQAAEALRVVRS